MKPIFKTQPKGFNEPIFIAARPCVGLIQIEKATGCKIEATGLNDDHFGLSYCVKRGQVWSLKTAKAYFCS